jgi:hypothetical protein
MTLNSETMRNKRLNLFFLLFVLLFQACIDEFQPDLKGYEQLLVVDGGVFDGIGQIRIKLSYSTDVYNPKLNLISGANVMIQDNFGETEVLEELENGVYTSSGIGIIGIPGRLYKLIVNTPNNKKYESEFEVLRPSMPIESIAYQTEFHSDERYPYALAGYQFYLNTQLPNDTNSFYMWRMVKTYEFHSEFVADAYFTNKRIYPFPKPDSLQVCWKTENVKQNILLNTNDVVNPDMKNFPLNFVNTEGRELSVRYSQLTEQLTINESTYNHYKLIEDGNSEQGSLYANQPIQIRSNVVNVNDPYEPVLGYFLVAGRSSQRLFVSPPDVEFHYYTFVLTSDDYENMRFIRYSSPGSWPIYLTKGGVDDGSLAWPSPECIDCRQRGGTLTKPPFWDIK